MSDPFTGVRIGAQAAAVDVLNYVNETHAEGVLDANELRNFLLDYWVNAGGLDHGES